MKTTFSQHWRMPMITVLTTICWILIACRLRVFLRNGYSRWKSVSGFGVVLLLLAGMVLIVYLFLQAAVFAMCQQIFNYYDRTLFTAGLTDLSKATAQNATDGEVKWMLGLGGPMRDMISTSRFLMTIGLWCAKGSILAVYFEAPMNLGRYGRILQQSTIPIMIVSFMLCIVVQWSSQVSVMSKPTAEDVRNDVYKNGLTFTMMSDSVELVVGLTNVITDLILIAFAVLTVRAVGYPVHSGFLLYIMSGLTILVAIARCGLIANTLNCDDECRASSNHLTQIMTPMMCVLEWEEYLCVMVACLPGLRAFLRSTNPNPNNHSPVGGHRGKEFITTSSSGKIVCDSPNDSYSGSVSGNFPQNLNNIDGGDGRRLLNIGGRPTPELIPHVNNMSPPMKQMA